MPVNRNTDVYGGRFASDPTGGSVLAGYQQATDKLDRDLVKRNIKPYAKYGFEQSISELAGMTDQRRYAMATKAVLAKNKVGAKPTKPDKPKPTKPPKPKPTKPPKPKPTRPPRPKPRPTKPPKPKPHKPPQQHLPPRPPPRLPPKTKPRLPPKPTPKRPPVVPPSGAIRV